MINIGEVSKPSVSESRVKPGRSSKDAERVTAIESLDITSRVSSQLEKKNNQNKNKKKSEDHEKQVIPKVLTEKISTTELEKIQSIEEGDDIYDENGELSHHAHFDLKV